MLDFEDQIIGVDSFLIGFFENYTNEPFYVWNDEYLLNGHYTYNE